MSVGRCGDAQRNCFFVIVVIGVDVSEFCLDFGVWALLFNSVANYTVEYI